MPERFQVSADFNYRVAIEPSPGAASLTTVIGDETTFEARKPGAYAIEVDGAVTNRSGRVHAAPVVAFFSAAACDFSVGTPAISAVTPPAGDTFPRGLSFFAGDRVTVASTASSTPTCASTHDTFSYRWTLLETPVGSAAQLNSTTLAQPTFVVDVPGGSYRLQVEVTDSLGNVKTSAVQTFTAGTCGKNPISVSASVLVAGALPFDPSTLKVAPRNGAFFSAELLIKLQAAGRQVAEVGVPHYPRLAGSPTGARPQVILRAIRDFWRLRIAMWLIWRSCRSLPSFST